jgi:hypothetical protein
VHDILISALWGLVDGLYVQAIAHKSVRPECNGISSYGRAYADVSWHGLVGVGGYDVAWRSRVLCLSFQYPIHEAELPIKSMAPPLTPGMTIIEKGRGK